ncbi:hypothetical protein [Mariniphaga sp.]|uniref:hypothetical protein n=1 Tax=Mariniphaga sp. TaxID=1954475 RepID=UPI003565F8EA
MKSRLIIVLLLFSVIRGMAQQSGNDMSWWNELHGWEEGDPGWRNWMKISPGYFGPNALPVPHVQKGELFKETEFELTFSNHFHPGDPTQDLSGYVYIPFASNKIAVEMYGVAFERFAFSEEIRNERFSRIKDGKGSAIGDFYFSTLIQVLKDRKFPNTLFRFGTKTASGNQLEGARYIDSPAYFLDLSFSKTIGNSETGAVKPFGMIGFYTWQTNDELNLQNDALLYGLGADYIKNTWLFSASCSGYSGYKNERDKPMQLHFDLRKDFAKKAYRVQYQHGLRHWEYKTLRFSYILKINRKE